MRNSVQEDAFFLERALSLARRGEGRTRPNPPVGAVIVSDGKIAGEGWHRRCGGDHAETAALKDAAPMSAATARGATMYVSLEPCSKAGRVGACTDAIAASGVKRVVYALSDPNPANRGKARKALARHGIECTLFKGDRRVAEEAAALIAPFAKTIRTGLPYVTVKIAMSLDGRICDGAGNAKWISSENARRRTGLLRARADAVMVGAGTLRADDPSLLSRTKPNPGLLRIIATSGRRPLPPGAQVFNDGARGRTVILCAGRKTLPPATARLAAEKGLLAAIAAPSLEEGLREIYRRTGAMHILCEGGMKLAVSLAEAGLADAWLAVIAPKVVGSRKIADAAEIESAAVLPDFPAGGGTFTDISILNDPPARERRRKTGETDNA